MNPLSAPRVALLAALACLLWSTPFAVIKIGLRHMEPLSFAGLRFVLAGLLLVPFWLGRARPWRGAAAHVRTILLLSFFQTSLLYGLFYMGLTLVQGSLGAIVIGSSPLISAVAAHFLMADDEMTVRKTLGISLGIVGIVVLALSRSPWTPAGLRELMGIGLLLLGSVSSALGNVLVARGRRDLDPVFLNSCQILLGGATLLALGALVEGPPRLAQSASFYGALLWLSTISAVAFSLWFHLLRQPGVRVSELNLWKFLIPVFGAVISWVVLPEESPSLFPVLGMVLVGASIVTCYSPWAAGRGKPQGDATR